MPSLFASSHVKSIRRYKTKIIHHSKRTWMLKFDVCRCSRSLLTFPHVTTCFLFTELGLNQCLKYPLAFPLVFFSQILIKVHSLECLIWCGWKSYYPHLFQWTFALMPDFTSCSSNSGRAAFFHFIIRQFFVVSLVKQKGILLQINNKGFT